MADFEVRTESETSVRHFPGTTQDEVYRALRISGRYGERYTLFQVKDGVPVEMESFRYDELISLRLSRGTVKSWAERGEYV